MTPVIYRGKRVLILPQNNVGLTRSLEMDITKIISLRF